jgi:hypothetical protein
MAQPASCCRARKAAAASIAATSSDLAGVAAHIVGNWDMPAVNYGQVILGGPLTDPMF